MDLAHTTRVTTAAVTTSSVREPGGTVHTGCAAHARPRMAGAARTAPLHVATRAPCPTHAASVALARDLHEVGRHERVLGGKLGLQQAKGHGLVAAAGEDEGAGGHDGEPTVFALE